ncbi:hypothetical protein IRZ71_19540 [Flavobacterium sp. ANB]|uniref:hypothetical protein n=1 Tax=unclassified Flavobacterium TaxID=196869 RepID=UPI0012B960A8|nr:MULTISPECIES: hypothetical protein [unclassified Flavobacterium]MBF4518555.1 hypothetical protein [Flavobacterium sp. ANB]MTD67939.1 hypothetical protein [Flavobacterium sp. LC2016-13]
MNVVEEEANSFYRDLFSRGKIHNLANYKSDLTLKLYDFNKNRDKLDFLKILRIKAVTDMDNHMKNCNGCGYEKEKKIGIFAIDQEIDDINRFYTYQPQPEQAFTNQEESNLHSKLNDILSELEKQGFGQQIIFDEIEDLKNHFNLGKKTWFQLLKGKLIDLTTEKILEKTIIASIFRTLSEGFQEVSKLIE